MCIGQSGGKWRMTKGMEFSHVAQKTVDQSLNIAFPSSFELKRWQRLYTIFHLFLNGKYIE